MDKHPLRRARESQAAAPELAVLLAPNVVFHSPILAKTVRGRELVSQVMAVAAEIRSGEYIQEMREGCSTFLVWRGLIDGELIETLELIVDDEAGLILERIVAMRPLSAASKFRQIFVEKTRGRLPDEYFGVTPELAREANLTKELP
ncbi:hypothetical protein [Rhodoferax ferrireducens]|uniref:hypothetical protein n=1 Tax=Rhodoferax ferrireducens TaxID=192843 RepID=UPI0013005B05|nr:hypothetical protein [Rhodoferax ferrireducens]